MQYQKINALSLFDGISCGQIALQRAGIKVDKYFASEIDKHAIKVTQHNWPNTIQLGDVTKWREWNIEWESIDLLCAGFPCQAWSVAGKQQGTNDPRGALAITLFELFTFLKEKNPKLKFLFENVKMKKEHLTYLNNLFGVEPIEINSALVSAQNRKRLYWTNIKNITQPKDKNIKLQDILDSGIADRDKTFCCRTGGGLSGPSNFKRYFTKSFGQYKFTQLVSKLSIEEKLNYMLPLSINELEKCQTLPINYTNSISVHQRYRAIGNGWTVDVIAHIFSFLPEEFKNG